MIVLHDVPVFAEGVHHGKEYGRDDLDLFARAARWTGDVPVRIGGHGRQYQQVGVARNFAAGADGVLRCDLEVGEEAAARMREQNLRQPSIAHSFTSAVCCEAVHEVALVARGDVDLPPITLPAEDDEVDLSIGIGGTG